MEGIICHFSQVTSNMGMKHRRDFLISSSALVMAGLSGCSGSSGGGGSGSWQEILNNRASVKEDEYKSWSWDIDQSAEIKWEFTVRSGPSLEFFVMTSREFDEYQARNRFRTLVNVSGKSDTNSQELEEGNYRFVIDNTSAGNTKPPSNFDDDIAEVELKVEAKSI